MEFLELVFFFIKAILAFGAAASVVTLAIAALPFILLFIVSALCWMIIGMGGLGAFVVSFLSAVATKQKDTSIDNIESKDLISEKDAALVTAPSEVIVNAEDTYNPEKTAKRMASSKDKTGPNNLWGWMLMGLIVVVPAYLILLKFFLG